MPYGRKLRGGDAILGDTVGNSPSFNSPTTRRHKKKTSHRRKSRPSRKHRSRQNRGTIKYTKNGQPYRIMANGRARFIKGKRKKKRR